MKKLFILLIGIIFLGACATNPITKSNFNPQTRPMPVWSAYLTGLIPGLPQLLNGEYLEAGIYFGAFLIPALLEESAMIPDPNDPNNQIVDPAQETYFNFMVGLSSIPMIWSYGDGVYSTSKYNKQWDYYASQYANKSEVVYRVIGSGLATSVDITLNNSNGGTEQYSKVPLPYEIFYRSFPSDYMYISAQNNGKYGRITVEIYYKGRLIKTATSAGAYVIATASAAKPE